eukprot:scaffold214108_cov28-Tisochrysis_lutea.AAC.1
MPDGLPGAHCHVDPSLSPQARLIRPPGSRRGVVVGVGGKGKGDVGGDPGKGVFLVAYRTPSSFKNQGFVSASGSGKHALPCRQRLNPIDRISIFDLEWWMVAIERISILGLVVVVVAMERFPTSFTSGRMVVNELFSPQIYGSLL